MTQRLSFVQSQLDTNKVENGVFCHWANTPNDGMPLYLPGAKNPDGSMDPNKRVGAIVRSTNSKAYDAHIDAVTRRSVQQNRKAKNEAVKQEIILAQLKKERPETFATLVVAFVNTSIESPGQWVPTEEEKIELARDPNNEWFVKQVIDFGEDISNFGEEAETDVGNVAAA